MNVKVVEVWFTVPTKYFHNISGTICNNTTETVHEHVAEEYSHVLLVSTLQVTESMFGSACMKEDNMIHANQHHTTTQSSSGVANKGFAGKLSVDI